jgi:hypothetical protein
MKQVRCHWLLLLQHHLARLCWQRVLNLFCLLHVRVAMQRMFTELL